MTHGESGAGFEPAVSELAEAGRVASLWLASFESRARRRAWAEARRGTPPPPAIAIDSVRMITPQVAMVKATAENVLQHGETHAVFILVKTLGGWTIASVTQLSPVG